MINLDADELDQTHLKEYLYGLKDKLTGANKRTAVVASRDFLPYKKKMHHFADQYLSSMESKRPLIQLSVDRTTLDDFVHSANSEFRNKYSKLWALMLHEEKRISMIKRF